MPLPIRMHISLSNRIQLSLFNVRNKPTKMGEHSCKLTELCITLKDRIVLTMLKLSMFPMFRVESMQHLGIWKRTIGGTISMIR